jgi:hypothetical protein
MCVVYASSGPGPSSEAPPGGLCLFLTAVLGCVCLLLCWAAHCWVRACVRRCVLLAVTKLVLEERKGDVRVHACMYVFCGVV